jgi:uncharacterized membrane protein YhhN
MHYFRPLTLFYFSVLAFEMYAESMQDLTVIYFTKPLLMPLLLVFFLLNNRKNAPAEKWLFSLALLFSLAGDVFLMFRRDDFFVFGLGSFLIGHLAYIVSFTVRIREAKISAMQILMKGIPFLLFVGAFLWFLHPYIMNDSETAPLFIPVAVYASIIALMGLGSLLRKNAVSDSGFWMVFLGALLFMVSDSCIAFNKFVSPLPHAGVLIMATYGVAQYMITLGMLKR